MLARRFPPNAASGFSIHNDVELEFLARVVSQLPEPRKHSIRYYGYYAAVVRDKRRQTTAEVRRPCPPPGMMPSEMTHRKRKVGDVRLAVASEPDTAERKQLRKCWAALIRRVYEVDPLLCACGATMRIVAIITERSVITKILTHMRKAGAATATEGSGPGPPRHPGRRSIPPSTEPSTTGWRDDRTGRSLLEQPHSAAQTLPTQPFPPPPCDRTAETAFTSFEDQPKIVSEHGKRSETLGISHAGGVEREMLFPIPLIPEGDFLVGKDEFPVRLPAFYLAVHPVTNAQYKKFLDETGHQPPDKADYDDTPVWNGKSYLAERTDHLVVCVDWADAQAYCRWAGLRLPRELEWEKGARGVDGRVFPWGNEWDQSKCRNGMNKGNEQTSGVWGYAKGASPWGLYQMVGNVYEWCEDWYESGAYDRYKTGDLSLPKSGGKRVVRGASWYTTMPATSGAAAATAPRRATGRTSRGSGVPRRA